MERIVDLSELCRLCLETSVLLIPFSLPASFAPGISVPELIKFCLDVNCNVNNDGILPKSMCHRCMEKLRVAYDLKTKSQESHKYLMQILNSTLSESNDQLPTHSNESNNQSYYQEDEEDSLLELVEQPARVDTLVERIKKGNRCGEFVCKVTGCGKTFRYIKSFQSHVKLHKVQPEPEHSVQLPVLSKKSNNRSYHQDEEEDSLLELVPEPKDSLVERIHGNRSGQFTCSVKGCEKLFRYVKSFNNHMKLHKKKLLTKSGTIRRSTKKTKSPIQPPYDSQSPYGSPAPYEASPNRESSPDFGATLISASQFITSDEPAEDKQNSPSREPTPLFELLKPKRRGRPKKRTRSTDNETPTVPVENEVEMVSSDDSNSKKVDSDYEDSPRRVSKGRPRKHLKKSDNSLEQNENEEEEETSPTFSNKPNRGRPRKKCKRDSEENLDDKSEGILEGFKEVDVNQVLKSKSFGIMTDDSTSQSTSMTRGRSRSPSVELIPDFDIFGSPTKALPQTNPLGSGKVFECPENGCSSKFHLRANLSRHRRDAHGKS